MEAFVPKTLNFQISEAKKRTGFQCCAYGCKNKPNAKKRGLCHKHYNIYRRIVDPVYNRFTNFKHNALRRGKPFTITLSQFREFCQNTGYIICKGKRGRKCSIDRIDNNKGYHIDNIQILTMGQNIDKYNNHDKHQPPDDDCPF